MFSHRAQDGRGFLIAENGSSPHHTGGGSGLYDLVSIPLRKKKVDIENMKAFRVLAVGSLKLRLH